MSDNYSYSPDDPDNLDNPNNASDSGNLSSDAPPELPASKDSADFDNFDPAQYLAKRRASTGRQRALDLDSNRASLARGGAGRRNHRGDGNEADITDGEMPVGLGARIIGALGRGEGIHIYADILGEALNVAKRFFPIIGLILVLLCGCVCGGGYLLIRLISR